jgi:hypothetical protein
MQSEILLIAGVGAIAIIALIIAILESKKKDKVIVLDRGTSWRWWPYHRGRFGRRRH